MKLLIALSLFLTAPDTMDRFGDLINADKVDEAIVMLETEAAAGDPDAASILGQIYDQGNDFVEQDLERAYELLLQAARRGHAYPQWRVGVMLDLGEGVEADPAAAIQWFELAAAQDYGSALTSLGVMHAMGRGTPQNFEKALKFYDRAARAGEAHGFYGLAVMYAMGEGVEVDLTEAMAHLIVADGMGDTQAGPLLEDELLQDVDVEAAKKRAQEIFKDYFPTAKGIDSFVSQG